MRVWKREELEGFCYIFPVVDEEAFEVVGDGNANRWSVEESFFLQEC